MYDEETQEFIGNVEELSGEIADLTKTASTPGGISLFTDDAKTEYKSTYQLLKEISEIYNQLSDKDQAALLADCLLFKSRQACNRCSIPGRKTCRGFILYI